MWKELNNYCDMNLKKILFYLDYFIVYYRSVVGVGGWGLGRVDYILFVEFY